ncbi:MAG TPA: hypothetical protein VG318_03185 [Actinomycetota bacterium]|nr:hypothetical protein [Actinomycetota bacterium]
MHRARTFTAVSLAVLLAAAAPAAAKSPHSEQRGGKKPLGSIVSFDPATSALVVDVAGDEDLTATVAEDAQVKLEHRGSHRRSKAHGNPSNGSLEDLVAGALVLRMKVEDEEVTKIRLRPAPAAETPPAEGDQSQDGTGGEDDVAGETPDEDEILDEGDTPDAGGDDTSTDGEDADTPDDGESGDV